MTKILHIVGTRPQYIKLFPLFRKISESTEWVQSVYDSGQHYDFHMSGQIIEEFGLSEAISYGDVAGLSVMDQFSKMLSDISNALVKFKPDYVYLYGDTNTTMAAAIACAKLDFEFGHLEAGVRTQETVGIQEGKNRLVADGLAKDCFCVDMADAKNLYAEGKSDNVTHHVGDLMYDAFHLVKENQCQPNYSRRKEALVTIHRAENVDDDDMRAHILSVLCEVGKCYDLIFPMHPRLSQKLSNEQRHTLEKNNIKIIKPLSFSSIVEQLHLVSAVITDSGGLPKDAACAGTASLVLRNDPIWKELQKKGYIQTLAKDNMVTSKIIIDFLEKSFEQNLPEWRKELAAEKIILLTKASLANR